MNIVLSIALLAASVGFTVWSAVVLLSAISGLRLSKVELQVSETELERAERELKISERITVTVTESAGADKAPVIFVDTDAALDGENGPQIRILLNDDPVFVGKEYEWVDEPTWDES